MILLHKNGVMVEVNQIESIKPQAGVNPFGERVVEINFISGLRAVFSDTWWCSGKGAELISVYDALLGAKFPVDWREKVK
jgi:hypothetical protein